MRRLRELFAWRARAQRTEAELGRVTAELIRTHGALKVAEWRRETAQAWALELHTRTQALESQLEDALRPGRWPYK